MRLRHLTARTAATACAVGILTTASLSAASGSPAAREPAFTAAPLATWQTNGTVWSVAAARGVVYVGGTFDSVRPPGAKPGVQEVARKNFAAFDAVTGELLPCTHTFTDGRAAVRVMRASPDGRVLFVGGSFGTVDGTGVANAVAIDTADCSLRKDFRPAVSATVRAIDSTDTTVYLGGDFTDVGGLPRGHLAAFTREGELLPFQAALDDSVRAILAAPDHAKLLVGGDFDQVDGVRRHALVALDPRTGTTVSSYPGWIPDGSRVKSLARQGSTFYLGAEGYGTGHFDGRIAGRLPDDRMLWKDTCYGGTQVVLPYGNVLYSGTHAHDCHETPGGFPEHTKRWHLLAQSADHKTLYHWYPDTDDGRGEGVGPRTMAVAGGILWVGGEFTEVNGQAQQFLTRFGTTSDAPVQEPPALSLCGLRDGRATLCWRAAWDRDDTVLTYRIHRDGTLLATLRQRSAPWDRPSMQYTDPVAAGSRHRYTLTVSDGTRAAPRSAPLTVTAPPATGEQGQPR